LAASEGFSRATDPATPQIYLDDAQPWLFPAGEQFCEQVPIASSDPTYRAFFLPEICSAPLGLRWPTSISFDDFILSITLLGRSYKPFLHTLDSIQPALTAWFEAVNTHPSTFAVHTCSYSSLEASAFPAFADGIYPDSIIDHRGFSPIMDMRYALAWRLHCDKVLTLTTGPCLQHFRTFLQRGTDGIMPDTYLRTMIPGRFCPNFGFHFQPHNKIWPTFFDPLSSTLNPRSL
jgi:hypothetical protein